MELNDENRAVFVINEYRYADIKDTAIKARNPAAKEVVINTQLDEADAEDLAQKYLDDNTNPRVWEIEIEGILEISSFIGGPPSFLANFPKYAKTTGSVKIVSASADYSTGITTIQVRG